NRRFKAVAHLAMLPAARVNEGLAMGTYDWMELQTLTNDIAAARARLAAARATKDIGKARGLEEEIARAEAQRDRLLAHITTNLVSAPDPAPAPKGREKDEPAAKGREKD